MIYRAQAHIDLSALKFNLNRVRQIVGQRKILAMIKANAYGHGLIQIARELNSEALGVASIDEALILRKNLPAARRIVVMSGFCDTEELALVIEHNLDVVIHQPEQLDLLEKHTFAKPLPVWFKIDTGMHRLGFLPHQVASAYQRLMDIPAVNKNIITMTHLADADNSDSAFVHKQLNNFDEMTQTIPSRKSIANSAAILAYPQTHQDWVRPGIMLYGASPFVERMGEQEGLQPVMTLTSKLIAIKDLLQGEYVGYGCAWQCPENMRIGIVAIGYGDGYPRHARSGTPVLINGAICPVIGRVSMDMISVDLRQQPKAAIDDQVILWGKGLPVEKVAAFADTIAYELLCDMTKRVHFIYEN